jgi:hypothetical protein
VYSQVRRRQESRPDPPGLPLLLAVPAEASAGARPGSEVWGQFPHVLRGMPSLVSFAPPAILGG